MMVRKCFGNAGLGHRRPGSVVPFLAISMTALIGFLALAIDLGMLAISTVQAQDAADCACLAAARTLSGDSTTSPPYNQGTATTNAQAVLGYNQILGRPIQASNQLTLTYGSYDYNQTTQSFSTNFPPTVQSTSTVNGKTVTVYVPTTVVQANIVTQNPQTAFASIFGVNSLVSVNATATAVHRPRDVAMVMDLSASMRFGTLSRFDFYYTDYYQWYGYPNNSPNNSDPLVPTFGHYSAGNAATYLIGPGTNQSSSIDNYTISPSNITAATTSYTETYINNFYSNNAYATTLIRAFDSTTSSDGGNTWTAGSGSGPTLPPASYATTPGGDVPLFKNGSSTNYATNVNDVVNGSSFNLRWELDGYSGYYQGATDNTVLTQADYSPASNGTKVAFNGYTQGPGYYGKTFFTWPPDPRNEASFPNNTQMSNTTLQELLAKIGISNTTDQNTLVSNWNTWRSQCTTNSHGVVTSSTGLTNLQKWLTGTTTKGGPYRTTGPYVTDPSFPSNTAPIYYAVCRLFNRGNPAGNNNPAFVADWRQRFFGTTNNTVLFDGPSGYNTGSMSIDNLNNRQFSVNYSAILQWIQNTDSNGNSLAWTGMSAPPNPFPTQMRAGRIKYYGTIPTQITGNSPSYGNTDQRFWKETIDYILGIYQGNDISGVFNQNDNWYTGAAGYGEDFTWGNTQISGPPTSGSGPAQYMSYTDNPARGRLRFWFGPLMMVDYLANCNLYESGIGYSFMDPGDGYVAPNYSGKQAFLGAVSTMQTNHPNDWFTLAFYNQPRGQATDYYSFNCVSCPLGTNYSYASSSLLFPFSTINANGSCNNTEVTPYDSDPVTGNVPSANFMDVPRANGDTCFSMGLMLAYNQFITTPTSDTNLRTFVSSNPINFPTGMAGGLGRKGAQKVVIFETDGMPNCGATASLQPLNGTGYSPSHYYNIRYDMNNPYGSQYPSTNTGIGLNSSAVVSQITGIIQQMGGTANTGGGGDFGTSRNPFRLYAIGFGPVFSGVDANQATATLKAMQNASGVTGYPYIITGTATTMTANMTSAFTDILQNGIQIALIK